VPELVDVLEEYGIEAVIQLVGAYNILHEIGYETICEYLVEHYGAYEERYDGISC